MVYDFQAPNLSSVSREHYGSIYNPSAWKGRQEGQKIKDIFGLIARLKPHEANLGYKR